MDFKYSQYAKEVLDFHMPRFDELPNIALYMDQVLSVIENSLAIFCADDEEKIITKSMINNYVKQKVVEKPVKKQYQQFHVAYFIMISILKRVLSISEISKIINYHDLEPAVLYDMFCDTLEKCLKSAFLDEEFKLDENASINQKMLTAAIKAFCNKVYFEKLMLFSEI